MNSIRTTLTITATAMALLAAVPAEAQGVFRGMDEGAQQGAQQAVDEGAEIILGPLFAQSVPGAAQVGRIHLAESISYRMSAERLAPAA